MHTVVDALGPGVLSLRVTLVSRFTMRAAGATCFSSSSASPQIYDGSTGRGTGPLTSSASVTYIRASRTTGS
jgi:hypothetical protein